MRSHWRAKGQVLEAVEGGESEYETSRRWGKREHAQVFTGLDAGMCPCQDASLPLSLIISVLVIYTRRNNALSLQLSPYSKVKSQTLRETSERAACAQTGAAHEQSFGQTHSLMATFLAELSPERDTHL